MVLLKLDITKAFDTADWAFCWWCSRRLDFGERWITLVCGLLSSVSTRVLVNGIAGGYIADKHGLRQGDPRLVLLGSVPGALQWVVTLPAGGDPKD